jgi:hypothetical protein
MVAFEIVNERGKGRCRDCGAFVHNNGPAKIPAANEVSRREMEAQLVAEYQPVGIVEREMCSALADALARRKLVGSDTAKQKRLIEMIADISKTLAAARDQRNAKAADVNLLDTLSATEFAAHAERLAAQARAIAAESPRQSNPPPSAPRSSTLAPAVLEAGTTPTPNERPEPQCDHCYRAMSKCIELQAANLEAWRAMHTNDPREIRRLDDEATAQQPGSDERRRFERLRAEGTRLLR